MKISKFFPVAAILATLITATFANATTSSPASDNKSHTPVDTLSAVEVHAAPMSYRKSNAAFQPARGAYYFDDGSILTLYKSGTKFYAEFTGQPTFEIIAVAADKFVNTTGETELTFKEAPNGLINEVVMRMPAKRGQTRDMVTYSSRR